MVSLAIAKFRSNNWKSSRPMSHGVRCKRRSVCWPRCRCTATSKWNCHWSLKRFSIKATSPTRKSYAKRTIIWMHVWLKIFNWRHRYSTYTSVYRFGIPYSSKDTLHKLICLGLWLIFSLRRRWRHKILILFKLMLLQKRIVCFGSPVRPTCSLILSILSLHPKLLEHGLGQAACVR